MNEKRYRYNGKIYCEEDLSLEIGDEWGGDLYDLYWELRTKDRAVYEETIYTHIASGRQYSDWEDLITAEYSDLGEG